MSRSFPAASEPPYGRFPRNGLSSDVLRERVRFGYPVDGGVTGAADHERLAAPFRHALCPRGLWLSPLVKIRELTDVVHLNVVRVPAQPGSSALRLHDPAQALESSPMPASNSMNSRSTA
jgi:hypothetical protein